MTSAIIGIKIGEWKNEPESWRAIHLEEGGSPQEAGAYLLTLTSQGKWIPGTLYDVGDGDKEMDSLLDGGSIKSLDTRVRSSSSLAREAEKVKTKKGWDALREEHDHAYLFNWRWGTLYYQGKALPAGVAMREISHVLAGKVE